MVLIMIVPHTIWHVVAMLIYVSTNLFKIYLYCLIGAIEVNRVKCAYDSVHVFLCVTTLAAAYPLYPLKTTPPPTSCVHPCDVASFLWMTYKFMTIASHMQIGFLHHFTLLWKKLS